MLQKQYDELPPPFGLKVIVSMPYKLQIAIMKTSLGHTLSSTQVLLLREEGQHTQGQRHSLRYIEDDRLHAQLPCRTFGYTTHAEASVTLVRPLHAK